MRAPPAPTLQNVLVSHPAAASKGTVAKPDDLLAAAVLAADDSHDIARPRGVLARVTRKWHALWHRRHARRRENANHTPGHGRSNSNATAAVVNADPSTWLLRSSRATPRPKPTAAIVAPTATPTPTSTPPPHPHPHPHPHPQSSSTCSCNCNAPAPIIDSRDLDKSTRVGDVSSKQLLLNRLETNACSQQCSLSSPYTSAREQQHEMPSSRSPSPGNNGNNYTAVNSNQHLNHMESDPLLHSSPTDNLSNGRTPSDLKPSQFSLPSVASQVILSRESALRAQRMEEHQLALERLDHDEQPDLADERCVSSLRENWSARRVRQVGAREDDDTVLQLPRVASVSFTSPSRGESRIKGSKSVDNAAGHRYHHHYKVVQLPRVSALMPTRAVRKSVQTQNKDLFSPVSSAGQQSRTGSDSGASDAMSGNARRRHLRSVRADAIPYADEDENDVDHDIAIDDDDAEDDDIIVDPGNNDDDCIDVESRSEVDICCSSDDEGEVLMEGGTGKDMNAVVDSRRRLTRLPTGLSKRDVEREMELAVVEIASDGAESDVEYSGSMDVAEPASGSPPTSASGRAEMESKSISVLVVGRECREAEPLVNESASVVREFGRVRSRSDAHDRRGCEEVADEPFVRRVSSSMQENDVCGEGALRLMTPRRFSTSATDGLSAVAGKCASPNVQIGCFTSGCLAPAEPVDQRQYRSNGVEELKENDVISEAEATGHRRGMSQPHDVAMFEDDYLSFQGFQNKSGESGTSSRSHYSGMSALLRSKRISSVTDSHSDESDDGPVGSSGRANDGGVQSSGKQKGSGGGRSGRLPHLLRKWSALEESHNNDFGG